ncbi:CBN-HAM-2 protein [Caenorhabditis brenneri]|uniref:CBN-HAM-2 protein n=1 Tax=Caenorhabditis brenneri TaxID=135651 RepID=G0M858_CAEBE|nr:CBN-HAM-2 protein [Caenorhabditis brenneri]
MPYRAELKRPDLKGSFPCSICQKVFCHSSSLSRHRMQAHFKSYTCTTCNDEIPTNDTLRSHMYRVHNITRMFMCRCCNWAFPDKTSLHIHMQSMLKNGTPGDAAVLAKSSDAGDCRSETTSPRRSPVFTPDMMIQKRMLQAAANNNNIGSIFPTLLKTPDSKSMFPLDLSNMGSSQFLAAWLANNPINNATLSLASQQTPSKDSIESSNISDYDDLEVQTTEEDIKFEVESSDVSPRSVIVKSEPGCKRKLEHEADIDVEGDDDGEPPLKMTIDEKDIHISHDQPSPTVSDSHISGGSSSHSGESSKCFDCQVARGKLVAVEDKCRAYEKTIRDLQIQIDLYRKFQANPMTPVMLPPPMMPLPPPGPNSFLQTPAMRMILNNLVHMNRPTIAP